jgi:hypothetical protein
VVIARYLGRRDTTRPVKDEQSVRALSTRLCVPVEVLHPLKAKLIGCLSIVAESDCLAWWEVIVPASLLELAS